MQRTYCGEITEKNLDQNVLFYGWVHRRRDHGGVIFLDVRDREGIVQLVFQPENASTFAIAETIRNEFVIKAQGLVRIRPEGQANPRLKTGQIEVVGHQLEILNESETPPFQIDEYQPVGEDVRLKYRYIDLRRPEIQTHFLLRNKVTHTIRNYMHDQGFLDIETPCLTKATPEGARDYLVPSRTHRGSFFALPQSPQLFKQLLMVSGFDKYYQIVRCFRDEDLRADRQPEFTQLDVEMSFIEENDVMSFMEHMLKHLFKQAIDVELKAFPQMTYAEAMRRFGSDKPDLRIPLELVDIADLVKDVDFKVFAEPANNPKARVVGLKLENGCNLLTRKQLDEYTRFVGIYGARGLAYIKVNDRDAGNDGLQSPILKFLDASVIESILDKMEARTGDIVFFGAGHHKMVNASMGALRQKLGLDLKLMTCEWAPLWVTEFPMFEEEQGRWSAMHHPFTAPADMTAEDIVNAKPDALISRAYDVVLNGYEIGGGSIRINNHALQLAVLEKLGISAESAQIQFGFLLDALKYGAPPHGGIAMGIDRIIMLMSGTDNIRDVIAFPKTQTAACLMTNAPANANPEQLKELGIKLQQLRASSQDVANVE